MRHIKKNPFWIFLFGILFCFAASCTVSQKTATIQPTKAGNNKKQKVSLPNHTVDSVGPIHGGGSGKPTQPTTSTASTQKKCPVMPTIIICSDVTYATTTIYSTDGYVTSATSIDGVSCAGFTQRPNIIIDATSYYVTDLRINGIAGKTNRISITYTFSKGNNTKSVPATECYGFADCSKTNGDGSTAPPNTDKIHTSRDKSRNQPANKQNKTKR
jgi:hypothetical protein